jgi:hypothetical protein
MGGKAPERLIHRRFDIGPTLVDRASRKIGTFEGASDRNRNGTNLPDVLE